MEPLFGEPFVALTDRAWFDFLRGRSRDGRVDEVNFWQPKATAPMKRMVPGLPIFFRLKKPDYAIVGYGFFAHFQVLDLDLAWQTFGEKNGDPTRERFLERIGQYRRIDLLDPTSRREPIGCTILRDAVFWPESRWLPWGAARGWHNNIVQGRTERDPVSVSLLMSTLQLERAHVPAELAAEPFELMTKDERSWVDGSVAMREGQGTFRLRLMKAYGRCAVTGEHTALVLDAAHIRPYLGPRSNHPQNGLLLTKEFHALFDAGYVTVTPDLEIRVSQRLRADFQNGRRYYPFDRKPLVVVPEDKSLAPSREALEWHMRHRFLAA